jgi:hypothetical protein
LWWADGKLGQCRCNKMQGPQPLMAHVHGVAYLFGLIFCKGFHRQIINDMVPWILVYIYIHLIPTILGSEPSWMGGVVILIRVHQTTKVWASST